MYILPTPTHLEVVALDGSSDIFFSRHFNYELNAASTRMNMHAAAPGRATPRGVHATACMPGLR